MKNPSLVAFAFIALAGAAHAQPVASMVADPYTAYLVEGRVVRADGRPAAGVVVERMSDARGRTPYSQGAYREVTDAQGSFRFRFGGLGLSTGLTWYLAAHRPGCPDAVVTLTLHRAPLPPSNMEGDVLTGARITLPRCAIDRRP